MNDRVKKAIVGAVVGILVGLLVEAVRPGTVDELCRELKGLPPGGPRSSAGRPALRVIRGGGEGTEGPAPGLQVVQGGGSR